eukprot:scaffold3945_cov105-Isochrysis_galbana.AAC.21
MAHGGVITGFTIRNVWPQIEACRHLARRNQCSFSGCLVEDVVRVGAFGKSQEGGRARAIHALAVSVRFSARMFARVGSCLSCSARRSREVEE